MLPVIKSQATERNLEFVESSRKKGESNKAWLKRQWDENGEAKVVLIGGVSATSQRLRIAQSHAKHDFTPSKWSHVALLVHEKGSEDFTAYQGFPFVETMCMSYPPATNAVFAHNMEMFDDPAMFPNIGCISVPGDVKLIMHAIEQFKYQRAICDAVRLTHAWLGYVWGVQPASPLVQEQGEPSACFVENVMRVVGVELSPQVTSRVACPETIWQSALWWHDYYHDKNVVSGAWSAPHDIFTA